MIELTRKELCVLYVIKLLNGLADEGVISHGGLEIHSDYLPLLDGFEITEEELKQVMDLLFSEEYVE